MNPFDSPHHPSPLNDYTTANLMYIEKGSGKKRPKQQKTLKRKEVDHARER